MIIDRFLAELGIARGSDDPLPDEVRARLLAELTSFLRVGQFSWPEWVQMSREVRELADHASQLIDRERAALIGMAAQGHDAALEMYAEVDDGQARCDQVAMEIADELSARRLRAERGGYDERPPPMNPLGDPMRSPL